MRPSSPLSSVPALNSNPSASAKLYLDFDGQPATSWDGYSVPATPAYDTDGDASTFSDSELANIQQIWARVSEKYSPFNVNVTTVLPANFNDKSAVRIVIGGTGTWTGGTYGGVAMVGSFYNASSNTAWIFEDNLANGDPKYTAEAAAHEAGHTFGLSHQKTYNAQGGLVAEYNQGDANRAPIMGNSYYATRGLWWNGPSGSATLMQDDMSIISSASNGFGYRADDRGNSAGAATALTMAGTSATGSGIIEQTSDADFFSFTTSAGQVSFTGNVAAYGATLDLKLEIQNGAGTVLASADTGSLGETVSANLAAGTYYLVAKSHGGYGDVGQYSLGGTVTLGGQATPTAEAGGPYTVAEGGSISLSGSASTGSGLSYAWDLDGDGIYGEVGASAAHGNETGASPTFVANGLDGPSAYTVSLQVTDSIGQTSTDTATVSITNVAPSLIISGAGIVNEASTYTLNLSGSDPGQDTIASWSINWGDGNIQSVSGNPGSVTHVYADNGSYTISASATDEDGTWSANTKALSVLNVTPTLGLSGGSPPSVTEGSTVTLALSSSDPGADTIGSWSINWGDGSIQSIVGNPTSASHVYGDNGIYNITASATDEDGTYSSPGAFVTVLNVAPTLSIGSPAPINEGSSLSLNLSHSDPGQDTIASWSINWGDGNIQSVSGSPGSVGHVYADNGTFSITATATDDDGTWAAPTGSVTVNNVAPTLSVGSPAPMNEGSSLSLNLSHSDPGQDTIASWSINWGDGNIQNVTGSPGSVSHIYADNGTFSITATATDEDGTWAAPAASLTVNNVAPTLTLGGNESVDQAVNYVLTLASTDPGDDTISSWTITWGDGNTQVVGGHPASVSHVYLIPGAISISATATDEDGTFPAIGKSISVIDTSLIPRVAGASSVAEGSSFTLNLSSTSPVGQTPTSWNINWGDGNTQSLPGSATSAAHTYADNGVYGVVASATAQFGTYRANTFSVSVMNVAPTMSVSGAGTTNEGSAYSLTLGGISDPGADTVVGWTIDWGDGATQTYTSGGTKTHVYADGPSTHTILVGLSDEDGSYSAVASKSVSVQDIPPTVGIAGPSGANEGAAYSITLSASDPGSDPISSWTIDWGDGAIDTVAGTAASASHIYGDNGSYNVAATASNGDGSWAAQGLTVTVQNVAPTIALAGPTTATEGSTYTLTLGNITDPGHDTVSTWTVDWGDGSSQNFASGGGKTHVFSDGAGSATIKVTLVDEDGTYANAGSYSINIANAPPTLNVTGGTSASEGGSYTLNLSASDPGQDTLGSWTINWGDGVIDNPAGDATSASHVYRDNGRYTIAISATDEDGTYSAAARQLNVGNVQPSLTVGGGPSVQEGDTYALTLSASDPGADTISNWRIDWGDGAIQNFAGSTSGAGHAYASLGSYVIRVTAVDEDGSYTAPVHPVDVTAQIPVLGGQFDDVTEPDGLDYTFSISLTYAHVPSSSEAPGNVQVLSPDGERLGARFVNSSQSPDGRQFVFAYVIDARGGTWDDLDNGDYSVLVSGLLPSPSVEQTAGDFQVRVPIVDHNPPTASLNSDGAPLALGTSGTFTVTWGDDRGIVAADLDDMDVVVSVPGGATAAARLITHDSNANALTATYQIDAPGGIWDASDNGTYTVSVGSDQVHDIGGNAVAAGSIGSFAVAIAPGSTAGRSARTARVLKAKADQTVSGLLTASQQHFYYKMTLAKTAVLRAVLDDAMAARVQFLRSDGRVLASSSVLADGSGVLNKKLAAGTYYIHVNLVGGLDTLYRLRLLMPAPAKAAK